MLLYPTCVLTVFAGEQLDVLANDVLAKDGAFTDYTDTDGNWNVNKSNGNAIDLTVWTRCVKCSICSVTVNAMVTTTVDDIGNFSGDMTKATLTVTVMVDGNLVWRRKHTATVAIVVEETLAVTITSM